MRTYDITLNDGKTYKFRLTALATSTFLKKHSMEGSAPWVGVISAVDSMEKQIDLINAALHYPKAPCQPSGADFVDMLTDMDYDESFRRDLVVEIAHASGLVDDDLKAELLDALNQNAAIVRKSMIAMLTGKEAEVDSEPEAPANPT